MAYIFGSIWDRFNRNALNELSKNVEFQGKSIQDIVADGQLTPSQYATLIQTVNGLISKGNVKLDDLDPEVLDVLSDASPEFNLLSIPRDRSVSPEKTTLFNTLSKNVATPGFKKWSISGGLIRSEVVLPSARMVIAKVEPDTFYTVTKIGESNRFYIATKSSLPTFSDINEPLDRIIKWDNVGKVSTFSTNETDRYLFIYVSNQEEEPLIQVEKGTVSTEYKNPTLIDKSFLPDDREDVINRSNTKTIIESPNGYLKRPDILSVIWIGPNEPTEVEPYDEWRETEGFTYFNDFEENAIGNADDWAEPWGKNGNKVVSVDLDYPDGGNSKIFQISPSVNQRYAVSWNELNADSRKMDGEVFMKARLPIKEYSAQLASIVLRGGGILDSENGYIIGPRPTSSGIIRVLRYKDGDSTEIAVFNSNVDFSKFFNLVARIDDDRIRAKIWQDGSTEPTDWQIDVINSEVTESGFMGFMTYSSLYSTHIDSVGFGTGGMRAPRRKLM